MRALLQSLSFLCDTMKLLQCMAPYYNGVLYLELPSQQELWDKYYTHAPELHRRFVEKYNISRTNT